MAISEEVANRRGFVFKTYSIITVFPRIQTIEKKNI